MVECIKKIETLAKENGVSGVKIGTLLGLKKSPLTDWKNGKSKPTAEQIKKLCDFFAISADELLNTNSHIKYTTDEQKLINYYRNCSSGNKQIIIAAAKSMQEQTELDTDVNLSASRIG